MSGHPSNYRRAGVTTFAGLGLVLAVALAACSSSATTPPAAGGSTASPAAIVSQAPATSPSAEVASASPSEATSPSAAATPSPTTGTGRYGGGTPTPKPTPRPTTKPAPKPTPKPVWIVVKTRSTGVGTVLVGPNGLTLYTLKSDPTNGSGCTGDCAANWPPFLVKAGTTIKGASGVNGAFGSFARGGKRQVTYKGRALYTFAGDSYAGDTNGQGINNVWFVAKP